LILSNCYVADSYTDLLMKMPSSTNIKVEAKSTTVLEDAGKQCLNCLEKKVRNLEKRKSRIEINREKAQKGTKLEKEQESSLKQYDQVSHDLEFARELHKQFLSINSEHEKILKKQAKRDKMALQSAEIKRVGEILHLQSTLDLLGGNEVREDFKTGKHGAVVLTGDNLDQLDKLYQAISPSRDENGTDYAERLNTAAEHLVNILEGKDRNVLGTTYKEIKELLNLINECGYFERAHEGKVEEDAEENVEETEEEPCEPKDSPVETPLETPEESLESTPEPQQQPIDLTVPNSDGAQSQLELPPPQQPINTIEQDALFAPNSTTAYQEDPERNYSSVYGTARPNPQNFESIINNRPFQFIQQSYVMTESQANAPSVVDPAVIHAQPAAGSSMAFISQGYEPQPSSVQQQSAQQSAPSMAELSQVGQGDSLQQKPSSQTPNQQIPQGFPQTNLQQNIQQGLYNAAAGVGQTIEENTSFDIPPSIPMPPSQSQDQSQLEAQQQEQDKKFQMNASAPVFQSMYSQGTSGQSAPVNVPHPAVPVPSSDIQTGQQTSDFTNATVSGNSDYQQGYQGNGFNNYSRGRNSFRGSRGGPANNRNSTGGPGQLQNGFTSRGSSNQNNSRGGNRANNNYQGYPPNNNYRPDNYQGQGNYSSGGFSKFQNNRGGMNSTGTPSSNGYQRGGPGGSSGRGGMRSMSQRGGNGGPRGAGGRGGFSRPPPNQ